MQLSQNQYVPVLKWKSAEKRSLRELEDGKKNSVMPVVELITPKLDEGTNEVSQDSEKQKKRGGRKKLSFEEKLMNMPLEIQKNWGEKPIFVDFSLLYAEGDTAKLKTRVIDIFTVNAPELGLHIVPVMNLNDNESVQQKLIEMTKVHRNGLCLRITTSNLTNIEKTNSEILSLLSTHSLFESDIDLFVDIKSIYEIEGAYMNCFNATQRLQNLTQWRNFIFSAGAIWRRTAFCFSNSERQMM